MLENIFKVLGSNDWSWTDDEVIHIAKGKYELPLTRKERWKKRKWMWKIYFNRVRNIRLDKKISKNNNGR